MYRRQQTNNINAKNTYIISSPYQQFFLSKKKVYSNNPKQIKKSVTVM